ncbi:LuxR family transcriptional regulator [Kribbella pittospori]|uniref:LuxR family transcriptional regulator n=1 Tax=Kribbella pittospori TaxID=722689 RepID=A0A4R0K4Z0_9ACTN|nr:LuxR family transcriptional regulator [Kribbella pittospori]TCC54420.1 LuxR family transcriptional regulator [Kribbella pittospori]
MGVASRSPRIAGRVEELANLSAVIQGAAQNEPAAAFVHGEAGVGKTRLVSTACDLASGVTVLWGRCVRFGAIDSPYVPLFSALQGWLEAASPAVVAEVLDAVPGAGELLPSLGGGGAQSPVRLLTVLDGLVTAIASHQPTVLVVDDVQWADVASRDALAYLINGFRAQRLAVITTYRDEELAVGDPMHSWLADLRRLPLVRDIRLQRLTRDETEQQLTLIMGGRPEQRLTDAVVQRSDGNPYLSELLVQGLPASTPELPTDLPAELAGALLAAWHRLSTPARELVRILAVAGRPSGVDDLTLVATAFGIGPEALSAALVEATTRGIVVALDSATCWFRHPLLAEVLYATFVPGEAAPYHAAWAKTLQTETAAGIDEVRWQGDLALHYEGAHDLPACLEASLRAADLAKRIKAIREEAVHLRRAARLWPAVHPEGSDADAEVDLLERVGRTTSQVGETDASYAAWSRARQLVDPAADPLRASRVLIESADKAWETGNIAAEPLAEARRAVELSREFPDSPEYAMALANLGDSEAWVGDLDSAQRHTDEAVRVAQRSEAVEALAMAYDARAFAYSREKQSDRDSAEALRFALLTGDPSLIGKGSLSRSNYLLYRGRDLESCQAELTGFHQMLEAGATGDAVYLGGSASRWLMEMAELTEASVVLRECLSLTGPPNGAAKVRLNASVLAVRRGDVELARIHLQRAKELIPSLEDRPGLEAPPILSEYLLATGRPAAALDLLERTMIPHSVDPRVNDRMLMWGARAAADLAQHARDHRDTTGEKAAQARLDDLVRIRDSIAYPPFEVLVTDDPIQPAMKALYVAESARCHADAPTSDLWAEAVDCCAAAGMKWQQMVATWRWAAALLDQGDSRRIAAGSLRTAHRLAMDLGALPLRQRLEELATLAAIPLDEPQPLLPSASEPSPFDSLTSREQEVLSYLVAGRTYPEIATALFISEKTVSTHVSHVLRKTGTTSRRQVAALALRLNQTLPR